MRLNLTGYTFLLVSLFLFITACNRNGEVEIPGNCIVTKWYSQGDTSQNAYRFTYNNQDRVVLWDGPGPGDNTYSYESGKITSRGTPPNENTYINYYLRSDSMAAYSVSYINGTQLDSTLYFYDAGQYLVKSVRYTAAFGKDSVLMEYASGNLSKITIYNSNGTAPQATFQYYPDSSKSWFYQALGPYNNNSIYLPWLGRGNKNLIKSYISEFNGNPSTVLFNYSFKPNGYIDQYTLSYLGTTTHYFFEYRCW
jgi:hypothetical protein